MSARLPLPRQDLPADGEDADVSPELQESDLHSLLGGEQPSSQKPGAKDTEAAAAELQLSTREDEVIGVISERLPDTPGAPARRRAPEHPGGGAGDREARPRQVRAAARTESLRHQATDHRLRHRAVGPDAGGQPRPPRHARPVDHPDNRWPRLGEYLVERPEAVDGLKKKAPPTLRPSSAALRRRRRLERRRVLAGGPLTKELVAMAAGIDLEQPRRRPGEGAFRTDTGSMRASPVLSVVAALRDVLRNNAIRRIEIAWTTGTAADWAFLRSCSWLPTTPVGRSQSACSGQFESCPRS